MELDLDHLTDTSVSGLAELVGADPDAPPAARRIESAFDLIVDHLGRWKGDPDEKLLTIFAISETLADYKDNIPAAITALPVRLVHKVDHESAPCH